MYSKQGCKEQNQLMCVNAILFSKPCLEKCIHIIHILFIKSQKTKKRLLTLSDKDLTVFLGTKNVEKYILNN